MASVARIDDLAQAVAALLATTSVTPPETPLGVNYTWMETFSLDQNDTTTLLQGTQVYVLPVLPKLSPFTRGFPKNGYTIAVVMAARYVPAGDPTDAWVSSVAYFWEQAIWYPLWNLPGLVLAGPNGVITGAVPDPETGPEATEYLDRDLLRENKLALIAANFEFIDKSNFQGVG